LLKIIRNRAVVYKKIGAEAFLIENNICPPVVGFVLKTA